VCVRTDTEEQGTLFPAHSVAGAQAAWGRGLHRLIKATHRGGGAAKGRQVQTLRGPGTGTGATLSQDPRSGPTGPPDISTPNLT